MLVFKILSYKSWFFNTIKTKDAEIQKLRKEKEEQNKKIATLQEEVRKYQDSLAVYALAHCAMNFSMMCVHHPKSGLSTESKQLLTKQLSTIFPQISGLFVGGGPSLSVPRYWFFALWNLLLCQID